ncbi:MAG: DNA polymerase III subunit gamma/tau, partial [Rhodobacterales bacterium]|nr:DNA polymerase III subunit gamma/tau [Rhodobacterales bacterium]
MADLDTPAPTDTATGAREPYRVLARKYRPTGFDGLIGQEALVRTLSNAIASGRLAHAFVLTGVRGIGKTTTARIIARALNCVGPDGTGGPTTEPCGVCPHCKAIAEDRHVDVLEMDAASRTGVDDIRELIEGVRYRPTSARFKIYIIDEVHMLSRNAFNALLKTLEEPPEHVKFVFATTEIRKVPVTVLSRCQRFDLRRIDTETLAAHFKAICGKEGVTASDGALAMIARAADGSVRDGLSLLDQAIAHGGAETGVSEDQVRGMLGLADRTRVFDLLAAVLGGDAKGALDQLAEQYAAGADPAVVLEDLLELTHWLTRVKVTPDAAAAPGIPEAEKVRGTDMAGRLAMPVLTRAWQMLLKGLGECRVAPSPLQAAEMLLIRLAYAADLPTPEEALKSLRGEGPASAPAPAASATPATPAP